MKRMSECIHSLSSGRSPQSLWGQPHSFHGEPVNPRGEPLGTRGGKMPCQWIWTLRSIGIDLTGALPSPYQGLPEGCLGAVITRLDP